MRSATLELQPPKTPSVVPGEQCPVRTFCLTDAGAIEQALLENPLGGWERLLEQDPMGTFFQGPVWTLCWYRAYRSLFDPLVIVVEQNGELIGVAPMAVEKRTGQLAFAGHELSDYRDVLALPGRREEVIRAFLRVYRAGGYPNVLRFGSTLPESSSPDILATISREEGIHSIRRSHFGWRWSPEKALDDPLKGRSTKYKLNCLKRRGQVAASLVSQSDDWQTIRDEYFDQHSLRQVLRKTGTSFDRAEKRAFFNRLFETPLAHVSVLRAGDKVIACHYGFVSKGVLYLGAPSFDVRDRQYSPGLLLVLLIMKQSATWGIESFDLTIGEGDFKQRYSTTQVVLPTVDIFPSARTYWRRRVRNYMVGALRRALEGIGKGEWWDVRVRPYNVKVAEHVTTLRAAGWVAGWKYLKDNVFAPYVNRSHTVAFAAEARSEPASATSKAAFGRNEIYHLLSGSNGNRYEAHKLAIVAGKLSEAAQNGADLHTLVIDGRLAAWGFSRLVQETADSASKGVVLPPGSAVLFELDAVPGATAALTHLITHIASERIREGATDVCLIAVDPDRATTRAIHGAGFQPSHTRVSTRVWRWEWQSSRSAEAVKA